MKRFLRSAVTALLFLLVLPLRSAGGKPDVPPRELADRIIEAAMLYIGSPYQYHAVGPNAFDCSGFTSYVYRQMGYTNIGASSRDQYARNIPVSRSEMKRGDLVFFSSPNSGRGVGHVGIVVDVDPITRTFNFIHASTSEGVKISNSSEGFYARRFIGVRRVL